MSETTTNPMLDLIVTTATDTIAQANAIAEKIAASRVNVNKMFHDWRDTDEPTDERVQKFQAYREDLLNRLEQAEKALREIYVSEVAETSAMSDEDYEAAKKEHADLRTKINATVKFLEMQPGGAEAAKSLPDVLGISGRKTGGTGTGGKRPRLAHATVNGETVQNDEGNVTFTLLAQHISKAAGEKVGPRDLQEAAFETAGTNDLSTVSEVEFGYSVNGQNFTVAVFPRQAEDESGE